MSSTGTFLKFREVNTLVQGHTAHEVRVKVKIHYGCLRSKVKGPRTSKVVGL